MLDLLNKRRQNKRKKEQSSLFIKVNREIKQDSFKMKQLLTKMKKWVKRPKKSEEDSRLYIKFINFRINTSFFMLFITQIVIGGCIGIENILEDEIVSGSISFIYTILLVFFFCVMRKRSSWFNSAIICSLIGRVVSRTIIGYIAQNIEERVTPALLLSNTLMTLITALSTPSILVHVCGVLSEVVVLTFYIVLYPAVFPHDYFVYFYFFSLCLYGLNAIILDFKLWTFFQESSKANNQLESLKSFLDKNLLSSIVVFSIPEKSKGKLDAKEEFLIEFLNSKASQLAFYLRGETEEEPKDLTENTDSFLLLNSQKGAPMPLEELGSFFKIKGSTASLAHEVKNYAKSVKEREKELWTNGSSPSSGLKPLKLLCNLVRSFKTQESSGSPTKSKKLLYMVVISSIIFNNKQCIILQMEDLSYVKSLKKERKLSMTREKAIQ